MNKLYYKILEPILECVLASLDYVDNLISKIRTKGKEDEKVDVFFYGKGSSIVELDKLEEEYEKKKGINKKKSKTIENKIE